MIGVDKNLPFKHYSEEVKKRRLKRLESAQDKIALEGARTGQLIAPSAFTSVLKPVRKGQVKKKARSRPKKIKRKSLAKLKKMLYAEIKKYLMASPLFTGYCPTCVPLRGAQAEVADTLCHKLPKGDFPAIQFDLDNLYIGCNRCNIAEYSRRALWAAKFREWMPLGKYESLEKRGREIRKWDRSWLEEKIRYYRSLSQEGIGG